MKRISMGDADCPVARTLDAIGDWWSLLIIRDAFDGLRRFGEFQRNLGISKGILTTRLRRLVALGILETLLVSEEGRYQEYALTAKGRGLFLVVVSLRQWGEDHCFARGQKHSTLVDNRHGKPVRRLLLRSAGGRVLDHSSTSVVKAPKARRIGERRGN
jgi:DNA-binding HxlR family transcriptional regulator